jgi:hypothetical protein
MRMVPISRLVCLVALVVLVVSVTADDRRPRRPAKDALLRGKITQVDPASKQVVLDVDGKEWKVNVDDRSRLRMNGRAARLEDFKKGMQVRIRYAKKEGRYLVDRMRTPFASHALGRTLRDLLQSAGSRVFDRRTEYRKQLEDALHEVDERIEDIEDRARDAGDAAEARISTELKDLRDKREAVNRNLDRLRSARADNWDDVKKSLQDSLNDLLKAYDRTTERLKGK